MTPKGRVITVNVPSAMRALAKFVIAVVLVCAASLDVFSQSDFECVVQNSHRAFLIEFYSGMCGSCTEFACVP